MHFSRSGARESVIQSINKSLNVHVSWGVLLLRSWCALGSIISPESGYYERVS
jgi:hypothetical protein